jgi:U2-associated protein SR140
VVSDLLSSAGTSGIRHAWRYRQLFENALRSRKLFETLGSLPDKLQWGRLRGEKWKRSIGVILSLWEGWCVFPAETQEYLKSSFENPPSLKKVEVKEDESKKMKWKTVNASTREDGTPAAEDEESYSEYTDDEEVDLRALDLEDIDGDPVVDAHIYYDGEEDTAVEDAPAKAPGPTTEAPEPPEVKTVGGFTVATTAIKPSRKRMRASDMFAGSGSDDGQ